MWNGFLWSDYGREKKSNTYTLGFQSVYRADVSSVTQRVHVALYLACGSSLEEGRLHRGVGKRPLTLCAHSLYSLSLPCFTRHDCPPNIGPISSEPRNTILCISTW